MAFDDVQSLVLRPTHATSVTHLLLRVVPTRGGGALAELQQALLDAPLTVGAGKGDADRLQCTLGFSYRGLEALGLPPPYLRVFARLSPAFAQGAPLRAAQLGDSGASAPSQWQPGFRLDAAHVVLTLHGPGPLVERTVLKFKLRWRGQFGLDWLQELRGERLGHPPGEDGEWVHFGYRDGESQHHVTGVLDTPRRSIAHAPGEFLLGYPNDSGFNPFCLPAAPQEVRDFFAGSSFGVVRPMRQDVVLFEQMVEQWRQQAELAFQHPISAAWVKAKLCGRWPGGEVIRPGQFEPKDDDIHLDFKDDADGMGCPWASHVRRMTPPRHGDAHQRARPLVRRGTPYGAATWIDAPGEPRNTERGLLGLFYCASLEDQFEHLLGQWANRRPLGAPDASDALDPIAGQHESQAPAMLVPHPGNPPLAFTGFKPWTQTLGTLFAWHPSGAAVQRVLGQDYVGPDDQGPWL